MTSLVDQCFCYQYGHSHLVLKICFEENEQISSLTGPFLHFLEFYWTFQYNVLGCFFSVLCGCCVAVALIVISVSSCSVCSHWAQSTQTRPDSSHHAASLCVLPSLVPVRVVCLCVYVRECVLVCPLRPLGFEYTWMPRGIKSLTAEQCVNEGPKIKTSQRRRGTFKRTIIVLLQSVWRSFVFSEGSSGGNPSCHLLNPWPLTPRLLPLNSAARHVCRFESSSEAVCVSWGLVSRLSATPNSHFVTL